MSSELPMLGLVLLGLVACQAALPGGGVSEGGRLVDLSHVYDADTLYWPTDEEGFQLEILAHGPGADGRHYAANRFSTAEHGGTHLDAPIHFSASGESVEEIPLERLMAPAVVIDASRQVGANPDYEITPEDLADWEAAHGPIPVGGIVLLRTGWGAWWGDRERYLGTVAMGPEALAGLHFPGLHPDAARWLAVERRVGAVGIDTASIDFGQSTGFESHRRLATHQIPAFENLANLHRLPVRGFQVIALPMKIAGGTGAPLRAVAIVP